MNQNLEIIHANGSGLEVVDVFGAFHRVDSRVINAEETLGEAEPTKSDLEAVLWKLKAGEVIEPTGEMVEPEIDSHIMMVLASDVDYRGSDGIQRFKISRYAGQDQYEEKEAAYKDALVDEWAAVGEGENSTVEWLVSFGLQLFWKNEAGEIAASDRIITRLVIQAEFSTPPTEAEILETFNPNYNTGFGLAELATPDRAKLRIANYVEGKRVWYEISHEMMQAMIVSKVIPPQLLSQFIFPTGTQENIKQRRVLEKKSHEGYRQVAVGLLGLQ